MREFADFDLLIAKAIAELAELERLEQMGPELRGADGAYCRLTAINRLLRSVLDLARAARTDDTSSQSMPTVH